MCAFIHTYIEWCSIRFLRECLRDCGTFSQFSCWTNLSRYKDVTCEIVTHLCSKFGKLVVKVLSSIIHFCYCDWRFASFHRIKTSEWPLLRYPVILTPIPSSEPLLALTQGNEVFSLKDKKPSNSLVFNENSDTIYFFMISFRIFQHFSFFFIYPFDMLPKSTPNGERKGQVDNETWERARRKTKNIFFTIFLKYSKETRGFTFTKLKIDTIAKKKKMDKKKEIPIFMRI